MRNRSLFVVIAVVLAVCSLAAQDDKQDDQAKLQGDWTLVSMELGGQKLGWALAKITKLTIKGDQWLVTESSGNVLEYSLRIGAAKNPKELDKTFDWPGQAGTLLGIYKLDGDAFTACWNSPGEPRPTKFTSGKDSVLVEYKRAAK